nr:NADH dehydrogenase subunit 2 [Micraspides sp.]
MYFNPLKTLFITTMFMGTILAISSLSWFTAWVGLELNLISFIPLIVSKNNQYSSEATLKYFLVQALASSVILVSAIMINMNFKIQPMLIMLALLMKTGVAPFHFWFPTIMEGISWMQAGILMTLQKLAPLALLLYSISYFSSLALSKFILLTSIVTSSLIGAFSGLNQTLTRKILAYSSISHLAWMITSMLMSNFLWLFYILVYSMIVYSIIFIFSFFQIFHLNHMPKKIPNSLANKIFLSSTFLSLGGLPPFTGFLPKWFLIQELLEKSMILLLIVLLISTLFTLFFYMNICLSTFAMSSMKKTSYYTLSYKLNIMIFSLNLMGMFVPSIFYLLF